MPAVVIEAGMMKVPTVATDTGAIRDMIEQGMTGEIVPLPDAALLRASLWSLLRNPKVRNEMGNSAREVFLRRFDIVPVANSWLALLNLVSSPRGLALSTTAGTR
jgi:glycosyltransferase involved in cell wall biosynthesis